MNITLSADDRIVKAARSWAQDHGTSLNRLVRDYLAGLVSVMEREEAAKAFARNARERAGRSEAGLGFRRDELYRGGRFGDSSGQSALDIAELRDEGGGS